MELAAGEPVVWNWEDKLAAYGWWPLIFYMFYLMSVVCDDYLVPAVDAICAHFRIPEDVAGATLVAFACNGPELLCNVCGIFVTQTDVGMGTIVGSAIFNVLCITGACPVVSPKGWLAVNWRYFLRDSIFSAVSIVLLYWALPVIDLLRASVLFGMSAVYVLVVAKSEAWFGEPEVQVPGGERRNSSSRRNSRGEHTDPMGPQSSTKSLGKEASDVYLALAESPSVILSPSDMVGRSPTSRRLNALNDVLLKPASLVLSATVPDLRLEIAPTVPRMLYAFFSAMAWLSGTAYVVCIGSDYINYYWGVPQGFLGLTLVAVGTSWPNLMASVITARQGRGDIAISNALGSNVQNVFLVLAAPIWVSVVLYGPYTSSGEDILASVIWMGVTLSWVFISTALSRFKLTSSAGWSFVMLYCLYLVYAIATL